MQAMSSCMLDVTSKSECEESSGEQGMFLVDGNRLPDAFKDGARARAVIRGDAECYVIAAASILAKVTRDRLMHGYHKLWPHYGFLENKGYGTPAHIQALLAHGPCTIHRMTFAPLKDKNLTKGPGK